MTKERRLAIQMWEYIRSEIKKRDNPQMNGDLHYFNEAADLDILKNRFIADQIKKHDFVMSACWFCRYINDCSKCPITTKHKSLEKHALGCMHGSSLYYIARYTPNKEKRLEACDKIIAALKGEYSTLKGDK